MSTDVNGYKVEPSADTDSTHAGNPHQHPQHPHNTQSHAQQQHHPQQQHAQQHAPGGHQASSHPRSNIHQAQGTNSYPSPHQPPQHQGHYQAPPPHHQQQQDNLHFYQSYGAPAGNHGQYQSNAGKSINRIPCFALSLVWLFVLLLPFCSIVLLFKKSRFVVLTMSETFCSVIVSFDAQHWGLWSTLSFSFEAT